MLSKYSGGRLQIGREKRPVEYRHAFDSNHVVLAGDQLLVIDDRLIRSADRFPAGR